MIGCLPTQALAFLAVFVYATHATQAIAFEWKPGLSYERENLESTQTVQTFEKCPIDLATTFMVNKDEYI